MKVLILAVAFAATLAPAAHAGCVDVGKTPTILTFTGVLETKTAPADVEGVTRPGAPFVSYILRLPRKICATGSYADPKKQFDDVHVSSRTEKALPWLASHVGKRITVSGEVFPALTAWHKAPLVLLLPEDWTPDDGDDTELHR